MALSLSNSERRAAGKTNIVNIRWAKSNDRSGPRRTIELIGCHAKVEYKILASPLDPAELVIILDECGREGWELVALAAVADYLPGEVIQAEAMPQGPEDEPHSKDVVPVEAFRYIFKRALA